MVINLDFNVIITFIVCILFLVILGKIFVLPFKSILRLIGNSIMGGLIIYIINLIGGLWGFHIGLNLITSIFVGILGIPGAILLFVIKMMII